MPVGIEKTLDFSMIHLITGAHKVLEFLVSRWSMKSHMFVDVYGKFGPTLKDVLNLMVLHL